MIHICPSIMVPEGWVFQENVTFTVTPRASHSPMKLGNTTACTCNQVSLEEPKGHARQTMQSLKESGILRQIMQP